jgi:DNA polymerase-3 subunit delta
MYVREFNQRLQKQLPKAVLLYGDNSYLIEYYITYYIEKLQATEEVLKLYYDDYSLEQAKNYLSQTSLFGGINFLLVKSDKKIPKKELDVLIALANKSDENYFLYGYEGSASDAKSMQSSFSEKKGGVWVRFFEPNMNEGVALLQQKAGQLALDIDHYALQHLLLLLNNNVALCVNELEKLAILEKPITKREIDSLVYSTAPLAMEKLLIELFQKKPIVETIEKLLELGEDEFSILRTTQFFINQIFLFHAFIKLHGYVDSAAILGYKLPKQIEEQKAQLALKVKSHTLLKIYEHLLKGELELKQTAGMQKEVVLYGLLIKMQGYL